MADPASLVTVALAGSFGVSILSVVALKGWQGWLELKRIELGNRPGPVPAAGARIEVSDLRERVRRLEAIANGVEI